MREQDIQAVACLEKQIFPDPWSEQGFRDALAQETVILLVAESDGEDSFFAGGAPRILGYVCLYLYGDEGEITNVAVATDARRLGIADELLTMILAESEKRGVQRIFLEVRQSNDPALHLYAKYGFLPCGLRKNYYHHPTEDALMMVREAPSME